MSWEELVQLFNLNKMMSLEDAITYIVGKRQKNN